MNMLPQRIFLMHTILNIYNGNPQMYVFKIVCNFHPRRVLFYKPLESAFTSCSCFVTFTAFVWGFLRLCKCLHSQMHFFSAGIIANMTSNSFQL